MEVAENQAPGPSGDEDVEHTLGQGGHRPRLLSAKPLPDVRHKTCPLCGKAFGNAKRGRCGGNKGGCDYTFLVNPQAKTAKLQRMALSQSGQQGHADGFTSAQAKFKYLCIEHCGMESAENEALGSFGDGEVEHTVGQGGWRPRLLSAKSLANLRHKKTCPLCGKVFGNAKRGRCGGNNGGCDYTFLVNPRAKTAKHKRKARSPSGQQGRADGFTSVQKAPVGFTSAHAKFKYLCSEVDKLAKESGWSFVVLASGSSEGELPRGRDDFYVERHRLEEFGVEVGVGVLRHGVGKSGSQLAAKEDLLQLHGGLTLYHLEQQLRKDGDMCRAEHIEGDGGGSVVGEPECPPEA